MNVNVLFPLKYIKCFYIINYNHGEKIEHWSPWYAKHEIFCLVIGMVEVHKFVVTFFL